LEAPAQSLQPDRQSLPVQRTVLAVQLQTLLDKESAIPPATTIEEETQEVSSSVQACAASTGAREFCSLAARWRIGWHPDGTATGTVQTS
jgi:hypothetical protein